MSFVMYGTHDDNTIKQMETCMNTGSAAAGVLCADGHLGYAHPIGGMELSKSCILSHQWV